MPETTDGSTTSTPTREQRTASDTLLRRAIGTLGSETVAPALGLTTTELGRLLASKRTMGLPQQRTLATAVLVLSEGHAELRRRAIALLSQVRAAAEFEAGVTERHMTPPVSARWWR